MCQLVGKPNQKVPVAPLQLIPVADKPFSRVVVDYVGPLPKTKVGKQYLRTVMCASTQFPEAIPLQNIKDKNKVKALIKFLPWWDFREQYRLTKVETLCVVCFSRLHTS